MNVSPYEAAAAKFLAASLAGKKSALLETAGPINVVIAGSVITFADEEAAKLGGVEGWAAKMAVHRFGDQIAPDIANIEGDGYDKLVAFLNAIAAQGTPMPTPPAWYDKFNRTPQ